MTQQLDNARFAMGREMGFIEGVLGRNLTKSEADTLMRELEVSQGYKTLPDIALATILEFTGQVDARAIRKDMFPFFSLL